MVQQKNLKNVVLDSNYRKKGQKCYMFEFNC